MKAYWKNCKGEIVSILPDLKINKMGCLHIEDGTQIALTIQPPSLELNKFPSDVDGIIYAIAMLEKALVKDSSVNKEDLTSRLEWELIRNS